MTLQTVGLCRDGILHDVNFAARRGEITTIIGPNGAGKSTLLAYLAGIARPTVGDVLLDGSPLAALSSRERARAISLVAQDTTVGADMRVEQLVETGRHPHIGRFDTATDDDRLRIAHALTLTATGHLAGRTVSSLSGGERQRVHIARALAQNAPYMLLDEPTSALDLKHQADVEKLLRSARSEGRAVVAVVHDLGLAARMSDTVTLLARGQVLAAGSVEETITEELIAQAYDVPVRIHTDPFTHSPVVTVVT
ncbi:ABC transporter ATP-binding protein [Corynebacterium timonense]|uniref:Iron complex transport system ATP-binding protein n=1 Tax=Corynebacterium timonense TaxID=441500 RepID=A0A1H1LBN3_9CORY|nr:ABC transporter ATP-binding protein [Corynebacterium timonense]SDR71916.1 iron complex transport system ATP-binding protein [Corynebacterium timonense]